MNLDNLPHKPTGVFFQPGDAFIKELADYLQGKIVLEVFAGSGYLASLLRQYDVKIQPTTLFHTIDNHQEKKYCDDIIELSAYDAVTQMAKKCDVLLMSWPTVTIEVARCAFAWKDIKGDLPIIYVGEVTDYKKNHLGGCATDEFFEMIKVIKEFNCYQGNLLEKAMVVMVE